VDSLFLGILGLIATIVGSALSYVTYVNPFVRFKWYLKRSSKWEKINRDDHSTFYGYIHQPGYTVSADWDREVVRGYNEEWIRAYPDRENNTSYYVEMHANGIFLGRELFVSLDGGRIFVPAPRVKRVDDIMMYYYNELQILLAKIISWYNWEVSIEEFAASQNIRLLLPKEVGLSE
jgi:hypothetical protein